MVRVDLKEAREAADRAHEQKAAKINAMRVGKKKVKDLLCQSARTIGLLFEMIDLDGSGTLNKEELHQAVLALGVKVPPHVSGAVFDEFDFDGSGEVTRTEFIKYVLRDALAASAQQVMNLFRQFDQDGSGKIDKAEFRKVMGLLGFDIQYDDLNRVFDDMDVNGDGSLTYHELHRQVRQGSTIRLARKFQVGNAGAISLHAKNKSYSLRGDFAQQAAAIRRPGTTPGTVSGEMLSFARVQTREASNFREQSPRSTDQSPRSKDQSPRSITQSPRSNSQLPADSPRRPQTAPPMMTKSLPDALLKRLELRPATAASAAASPSTAAPAPAPHTSMSFAGLLSTSKSFMGFGSTSSALPHAGAGGVRAAHSSSALTVSSARRRAAQLSQHTSSVQPLMLVENESAACRGSLTVEKVQKATDVRKDRNLADADLRLSTIVFKHKLIGSCNRWTEPLPSVSPEGVPLWTKTAVRLVAGRPSYTLRSY